MELKTKITKNDLKVLSKSPTGRTVDHPGLLFKGKRTLTKQMNLLRTSNPNIFRIWIRPESVDLRLLRQVALCVLIVEKSGKGCISMLFYKNGLAFLILAACSCRTSRHKGKLAYLNFSEKKEDLFTKFHSLEAIKFGVENFNHHEYFFQSWKS